VTHCLFIAARERATEGWRTGAIGARAQGAKVPPTAERPGMVQELVGRPGRGWLPAKEALGRFAAWRVARPWIKDDLPLVAFLVFQSTAGRR
jgi:hypothetical protein